MTVVAITGAAGTLGRHLIPMLLARGDRVELRGFGAFSVKRREARRGRNPRTGAAVAVSEKAIPVFKTGKEMRQRLNAAGIGENASAAE